ncbi:MAG TPA: hypothetical protein VNS58_17695 [Puia sp.]|nr:hypothetical protein [Puia sp.]
MEPLSWSARFSRLRQWFWIFFLLTIGYMIWARNYLSPLSSGEIVQFEIAKTVDRANAIINDWKITGKYEKGVKSIYFAYLFIALYTVAIGLGCRFIAACTGNDILTKGGRGFAWLIVGAAICDIIENIALSRTLLGHVTHINVIIAYNLARIKFSVVIVCVLFMMACALYWAISRLAGDEK